ncbi:type VI secretion system protein ImpM [Paucimonas lemoignei]|uniref:Type VI secretion system protein ImpM n=1 Tax=Paucimonas lemoignei TaxID=29443 RepID=A0A4R3I620_PAULE|nr:type VI secretion system-associated protein TagF [Paucimonas lemoignei]TCS39469.1 type VI secretion system protein ImpM [Paucimonas lemoignei]
MQLKNPSTLYFGKIPARGDFVKSATGIKVISLIDNWVAQGMELLLAEPGWKIYYDNAGIVDFLFIGTHKKHAIAGQLMPSRDASSRRFPFIAASLFEIDEPLDFLRLGTLMLEPHVNRLRALVQYAVTTHDANEVLGSLNEIHLEAEIDDQTIAGAYNRHLSSANLDSFKQSLALPSENSSLRHMILALGYLLQPMLSNYSIPPQKGLALPLPRDPAQSKLARCFWLDLIGTFLLRAEMELSIFSCTHFGLPKLIVTFNGVPPNIYRALFNEQSAEECLIDVSQSAWVEECVMQDLGTIKLSSYLSHGDLALKQVVETFRQCFAGL